MSTVPNEEIERDLSWYLSQVEAGEKLVLTRAGEPIAEITPIAGAADRSPDGEAAAGEQKPRPIGLAEGLFVEAPDFDAPLPEELLRLFEGR
jgi:antitoxin (DNA-binding transcriptional repressor) of toxin-antitoxin stability system